MHIYCVASKHSDVIPLHDASVVLKGFGKADVHFSAYGRLSAKLLPVVKSLMFGEPCSTVPVWKRG